jgi:8-oxo-dGTP diphosphatase
MRVVAGVAINNGKVLVAKRAPIKTLAGFWEFPGGKVQFSESDHAALIREFREEFAIDINPESLICESYSKLENIRMFSYLITLTSQPVVSDSHDEIRWVSKEELLELKVCPLDVDVVNVLVELI